MLGREVDHELESDNIMELATPSRGCADRRRRHRRSARSSLEVSEEALPT